MLALDAALPMVVDLDVESAVDGVEWGFVDVEDEGASNKSVLRKSEASIFGYP